MCAEDELTRAPLVRVRRDVVRPLAHVRRGHPFGGAERDERFDARARLLSTFSRHTGRLRGALHLELRKHVDRERAACIFFDLALDDVERLRLRRSATASREAGAERTALSGEAQLKNKSKMQF